MEQIREEEMEKHIQQYHTKSPFHNCTYQQYTSAVQTNPYATAKSSCSDIDPTSFYAPCDSTACLGVDEPLSSFLDRPDVSSLPSSLTPIGRGVYDSFLKDIEAYEGAALSQLSAMHAGEELTGVPDCNMQVVSGFGHMLGQIVRQNQLAYQLDTEVTRIEYGMNDVVVTARKVSPGDRKPTSHGSSVHPIELPPTPPPAAASSTETASSNHVDELIQFRSKFVIVTVPLGILKRNLIEFSPPLPPTKVDAIRRLGFGLLNKVILRFDQPWWKHEDINLIAIMQQPSEQPLWIVNLSRAIQRYKEIQRQREEEAAAGTASSVALHSPAWLAYTQHEAAPLAPPFLDEEEVQGETLNQHTPDTTTTTPVTNPSTSSSTPSPSPSSSSGPYYLVSFHHNFCSSPSVANLGTSKHELRSDDAIVSELMEQLRRAFGGGVEAHAHTQNEEEEDGDGDAVRSLDSSRIVHSASVRSTSRIEEVTRVKLDGHEETIPLPHSHRFMPTTFMSETHPPIDIPDPAGYIVTRWGLDPHAYGAYTHYTPGSGAHTCAELSRPVAATDATANENGSGDVGDSTLPSAPIPRLLFAGEATIGVHLGCVDSAWLSGIREATRINNLINKFNTNDQ